MSNLRIKLLQTILLAGFREPVRAGNVVEARDEADEIEYKALIAIAFAKETTEKVTITAEEANALVPGHGVTPAPPISGISNEDDKVFGDLLKGNVDQVVAQLDAFDAAQLARIGELEAKDGKPRKGVTDAIEAATAKLNAPQE